MCIHGFKTKLGLNGQTGTFVGPDGEKPDGERFLVKLAGHIENISFRAVNIGIIVDETVQGDLRIPSTTAENRFVANVPGMSGMLAGRNSRLTQPNMNACSPSFPFTLAHRVRSTSQLSQLETRSKLPYGYTHTHTHKHTNKHTHTKHTHTHTHTHTMFRDGSKCIQGFIRPTVFVLPIAYACSQG